MQENRPGVWDKLKRNKGAMAGLAYIALLFAVALLGPFIRPDSTPRCNDQQLNLAKQKPGFSALMLRKAKNGYQNPSLWSKISHYGWDRSYEEIPIEQYRIEGDSIFWVDYSAYFIEEDLKKESGTSLQDVYYDLEKDDASLAGQILVEAVQKHNLYTKTYALGTDKYGRDLLSRLMGGAIISLAVGLIAVLISLLVGMTLGALAGYYRGWVDDVIMWMINVVWSIPTLLLVMAIVFAFGKGFDKVFIAVGLTMWVEVARVVRGQILGIREKEFVEAGHALGYSDGRILFRHILPNVINPVIVISAANFSAAILIEAGLSFLGIGAQIPTPSWGNLIKEHYAFITTDVAYLAILPGVAIMLLVLSFMMLGNGLRDALDVKG